MVVRFNFSDVSLEDVKKRYHLNEICPSDTAQKENVALSIKLLYFYCDMLKSRYPFDVEALLCREIVILSYSVLDGLVGCLGFKLQHSCGICTHRCSRYSQKMYEGATIRENEQRSFAVADAYLRSCGIIDMTKDADQFYRDYRQTRNNIHLTKNCDVITDDRRFTRAYCNRAVRFLEEFIEMLYVNYVDFIKKNKCPILNR